MKHHDATDGRDASPAGALRAKLRGILLPFPTPFGADGEVDARAVRSNIERWERERVGVSGYVALGSTGERLHLDEREASKVVEAAREAVPRERAFVVGVGGHSTRAAVSEARRAAAAGADAVLALTPHFYRGAMTTGALVAHFTAVADASPVPVMLYNIPQNTGVALAPGAVARLAAHGNVAGIKDSSGDMVNHVEMLRLTDGARADFAVLTGHAQVLYTSLCAGADGAILAAACAAPSLCVAVYRAFAAGDYEHARLLQRRLAPLAQAVTARYGIGGLKAALDLLGYRGGEVRAPLAMPDEAARRDIARLVEESLGGHEGADADAAPGGGQPRLAEARAE